MNETGREETDLSRRDFLRLGWKTTKATAAGSVAAHLISHEGQKLMESSFVVNGGAYFPIYENHAFGPEGRLPENLDVMFWEYNTDDPNLIYTADPFMVDLDLLLKTLRQSVLTGHENSLLLKIENERGRIALGDVGSKKVWDNFEKSFSSEEKRKETIKFIAGLSGVMAKVLIPDRDKGSQQQSYQITRRQFLKDMAFTAGAVTVLSSRFFQKFLASAEAMYGQTPASAMVNVLYRLSGMASNFKPGDVTRLYRNLFMADKLLLLGEHFSKAKQKPRVGFKLGKGHQGIEDLLYIGRPSIHELLLALYGQFIGENVSEYGIDYLTKIRILKYEDINLSDGTPSVTLVDEATLIDDELLAKLKERFPKV